MKPLLSILITTYNRAYFLDKCLQSIVEKISSYDEIEIVVLDNGSEDNTSEIISKYEKYIPSLIKERVEKNLTFSGGIVKVQSMANGKYNWYIGDDDILFENIDKKLLPILKEESPDLIALNHFFYIQMSANDKPKFLKRDNFSIIRANSRKIFSDYKNYIENVAHINGFFTHIATVIFPSSQFKKYYREEIFQKYYESKSQHIFIFLSILKDSKKVIFFEKPIVSLRVGAPPHDDWYSEDGRIERILMSSKYFVKIFEDVFKERNLLNHFKKLILKDDIFVLIVGAKINMESNFAYYYKIYKILKSYYSNFIFFWVVITPMLFIPKFIYRVTYKMLK